MQDNESSTAQVRREDALVIISASGPRRMLGIGMLWLMGLLLVWIGFSQDFSHPVYLILIIVFGLVALWIGERLRQATRREIWLTSDVLCDDTGRILATIENVQAVDRGTFAFKPSNGFLLRLREAGRTTWQPGLWWRYGRRVGVGGVISANQSKAVAEAIAMQLLDSGPET